MNFNVLNHFIVNDTHFIHVIDTETDATHIMDEDENVIYTVDNGARVFDAKGMNLGCFMTDTSGLWKFVPIERGSVEITTGNVDLIKAEMKVFKLFLSLKG